MPLLTPDVTEEDIQFPLGQREFKHLLQMISLGSSCMPLLTPDVTEEDIQFPLGQREFKHLLQMISLGKNRISLTIFSEILKQSAKAFENLPNITDIQLKENESVNVCGDLHGNLPALLQIFDQLLNLLWSDPQLKPGSRLNSYRGGGSYFGPDVTEAFLQRFGFKLIIRSHQCFPEGWQLTHSAQVLTVFSSFDYFGHATNEGVFMRLSVITISDWCQVLTTCTHLQLSWRCLRTFLVEKSMGDPSKVHYRSMFKGPCVYHPSLKDHPHLAEDLFVNRETLLAVQRLTNDISE
ncbi:hypothetical protein AHF37_01038 [Paragonimus kellicotti]|nr:hypothetical protein AHF37_01038 [Paragonimus kellicotti]